MDLDTLVFNRSIGLKTGFRMLGFLVFIVAAKEL
jgi:hypothetical protein